MDPADPTPASTLIEPLVAWYQANARVLPWRSDPTPYHVLLSELMLQQTRVDTVIPYFERFLQRWPTLRSLAEAEEEEVLHMWSGLGYYSRARNLHRCARLASRAGGLPRDVSSLRALPGIGRYTAGAIASIAFAQGVPLVDGNVERVLSRVDGRTADPKSAEGRRALWARAEALQDALEAPHHPGELNQALMELGATVCTPTHPACPTCPVATCCIALRTGIAAQLPRRRPRTPPRAVMGVAGIHRSSLGVLLGRRPRGLLGGMWEPPRVEIEPCEDPAAALCAAFRERAGVDVRVRATIGRVVHVFSHRRLTTTVYAVEGDLPTKLSPAWYEEIRVTPDPGCVALSTLARKILACESRPTLPIEPSSR